MNCPRERRTTGAVAVFMCLLLGRVGQTDALAYGLNYVVADMRQPASVSGGTACPQTMRWNIGSPGSINRRWSTSLGTNPVTILTASQNSSAQLNEIETVISQGLSAWSGIAGTALVPSVLGTLTRTSTTNACAVDGLNTICLNQADPAFTAGVLAFTRVLTSDVIGEEAASGTSPSTFIGQVLDADVLVRPADATTKFATPAALPSNPGAYDLASILTHEIGHSFGLGHSAVWRAIMFPFASAAGTYVGVRPTSQTPDSQLSDDDRSAIRVLYPNEANSVYMGVISGRVVPANPLVLAGEPAGTTGIMGAQVVALNSESGAVIGASLSGWSCSDPGPAVFDGSYQIGGLTAGPSQAYQVYAEPLDGPVYPINEYYGQTSLCRSSSTDPDWPTQFACTTPSVVNNFSTAFRAGP